MRNGMRKEVAIEVTAKSRYGTPEEKKEAEVLEAIELANIKINSMD